jgi:hypothetical protein
MNFNKLSLLFGFMVIFLFAALIISCEKEVFSPANETYSSDIISNKNINKGKGKGKNRDIKPVEDTLGTTYQLYLADDFDPLYKFTISPSGDLMLLETNPTVTSWGTNYWGYWSDPFLYANNEVNYIIGLTNTTYRFQPLPGNKMDVTKTLIVQPYPSGPPTTTETHPGVYILFN